MGMLIKSIAILALFAAISAPTFLIFLSAIRYKRITGGISSWAILVGALLLTLLTLDVFYPLVLTLVLKMNAQQLAEATIFLAYAKPAVTYVALLLLGIGMWIQSKKMKVIITKAGSGEET